MTERDLAHLKELAAPEADGAAKRAAIAAALSAFDAAHGVTAADEKKQSEHQGSVVAFGPTETSKAKRSFRMFLSSRSTQAIAASIAALVIAAPFAFQHMETLRDQGDIASAPTIGRADTQPNGYVSEKKIAAGKPASAADSVAAVGATAAVRESERAAQPAEALVAPPPPSLGLSYLGSSARMPAEPSSAYIRMKREHLAADRQRLVRPGEAIQLGQSYADRDQFETVDANPVKDVAREPVSTFSLDVDTASYAFVRRSLNAGVLPPKAAVRVEEMINYFPYDYPAPDTTDAPFKPTVTVMPSPWNSHNKLVHIAIKGYDLKSAERPKANLVFLIDVSGSMAGEDRLPLIKNAFRLLVEQLKPDDTVGIVTYASGSGVLLEPTKVSERGKIFSAIDRLDAGGSTAGAAGIEDAYRLAEAGFDKAAVNRVILATDGDFNVGVSNREALKDTIERKRKSGIYLSILGVGRGNLNDALMQTLAQNGNGTAAYVDTLNEARKVLVDEASSTLFTIAKDVKVQVEWNPARVSEYRLIGYETRGLKREDFNNDGVDAGDVGSGHTVTAIYEITPVGAPKLADDLRYGKTAAAPAAGKTDDAGGDEFGFLKIRYKAPGGDTSKLISLPIGDALARPDMGDVPAEQRFSVAVAGFGQLLKGESYVGQYSYDDVLKLAQGARGEDPYGYRAEFLNLVRLAKAAR